MCIAEILRACMCADSGRFPCISLIEYGVRDDYARAVYYMYACAMGFFVALNGKFGVGENLQID